MHSPLPAKAPLREYVERLLDTPLSWFAGILAQLANPPGAWVPPVDPKPEPIPPVDPDPVPPTPVPPEPLPPPPDPIPPPPPSAERHAYFDYLTSLPEFWKGMSFRPQVGHGPDSPHYDKQLLAKKQGGYADSGSNPLQVLYDPEADAARIEIPAFSAGLLQLSHDVDANKTYFVPKIWSSGLVNKRQLRLGSEIVTITNADPRTVVPRGMVVARAQYGTTATPHAAGTVIETATNSLASSIRFPLLTENGFRYFFVWDVLYTDTYLGTGLTNHKAFQFATNKSNDQWCETQTRFDGGAAKAGRHPEWDPSQHVCGLEVRSYNYPGGPADWSLSNGNQLGPGVTDAEPIVPKTGAFNLHPNRWTRLFFTFDQRANDYDLMNFWAADEVLGAVQIYKDIPMSVQNSAAYGEAIVNWWVEMNTSTAELTPGRTRDMRSLVSFIRNFGSLKLPLGSDVSGLLLQPK